MTSTHPTQPDTDTAPTPAPMGQPPRGVLPGAATYVVLAIWSAVVVAAIVAGAFAGGGASQLLLPASQATPSPPSRSPTAPGHGSGATCSASTCGWCWRHSCGA
jgi:hypothetical protein